MPFRKKGYEAIMTLINLIVLVTNRALENLQKNKIKTRYDSNLFCRFALSYVDWGIVCFFRKLIQQVHNVSRSIFVLRVIN